MARIPLTSGFQIIPEGNYTFKCSEIEYKEDFGSLRISFVTATGLKHEERYNLLSSDGTTPNEKALNAFSFLAKNLLNDFNAADVDPDELKDHYINASITHTEIVNSKGEKRTYAHLKDLSPAESYETASVDLDSLLG